MPSTKFLNNLSSSTNTRRSSKNPQPRRMSNMAATREDLFDGPTIVIPPKTVDHERKSDAHETALEIEIAKLHLQEQGSDESTPDESGSATPESGIDGEGKVQIPEKADRPELRTTDKYAFAFDIDGVLVRGGEPIPEAIQAMRVLNGDNEYGVKVPYIFVTNGGGKTEEERCIDLSRQLKIEVSPGQFICGHTPMREMAEKYHTVLVIGGEGEKCRQVAEGYGFKDVVTPGDIIKDNKHTTPFRKLTEKEIENSRLRNFGEMEIQAVFVFADSRDWAGDQQILLDLCTSKNGRLGTRSENYDQGPPIYFSHNDVVWSTSHQHTRLGMGALRASLEAMFKTITGKELKTVAFGKPQLGTFQFATRLLRQWRKDTHGIDEPPDTVYFVGDTPESDIRGANEFNESGRADNSWYSILVRTGVFREGTQPRFAPKMTVDNVLEAVQYAMKREFMKSVKAATVGEVPLDEVAIEE